MAASDNTKPDTTRGGDNRVSLDFILNFDRQLRAPLNTVLGMLDFLTQTSLTSEQRDYISNIQNAAEEMEQLLQRLVLIIESESSSYQLKKDVFSIRELLLYLKTEVKQSQGRDCDSCVISIGSDIPEEVVGDRDTIVEALSAIIAFAFSTGEASPSLDLKLTQESNDRLFIRVSVCQSAPTLSEPELHLAFDNADSTNVWRSNRKIVINLILAKILLRLYGSKVQWRLNEQKSLELECYFHVQRHTDERRPGNELANLPSNYRTNAHILVVEDLELNQLVTKLMLENYGCTVDIASNGQEALDIFTPEKYDCIFMDIEMPVMDGITATQRIREKYGNAVPVIGLSADALSSDPEYYLKAGLDDYVTKPVKKETLAMKVHYWTMRASRNTA